MKKKIYFAGSIRGGRVDAALYQRMIGYIQKTDIVLTEHIGKPDLSLVSKTKPSTPTSMSKILHGSEKAIWLLPSALVLRLA